MKYPTKECTGGILFCLVAMLSGAGLYAQDHAAALNDSTIAVQRTSDFMLTGDGKETNWNHTGWIRLSRLGNAVEYETSFKIMYSDSGIYCLYRNEDRQIKASLSADFDNLYTEDVVEAFFWPDQAARLYFEYELSPLNYELPILVPNFHGDFLGWLPWHYKGIRRTRHAVQIDKDEAGSVTGWTAEFFIPFALLKPLQNVPPRKGSAWKANFYRIDYDHGEVGWAWRPVIGSFHQVEKYGTLVFK